MHVYGLVSTILVSRTLITLGRGCQNRGSPVSLGTLIHERTRFFEINDYTVIYLDSLSLEQETKR